MDFNKLRETAMDELAHGAGIIVSDFDPTTGTVDEADILYVTSGGIEFTDTPSFKDYGEDIDNCPKNTKELKEIEDREVKVSFTALNFTENTLKYGMNIATSTSATKGKKFTPTDTIPAAAFHDVWLLTNRHDGGGLAVKLINALTTGGFSITTQDNDKGQSDVEYTGHYSIKDKTVVPYEIYLLDTDVEAAAG